MKENRTLNTRKRLFAPVKLFSIGNMSITQQLKEIKKMKSISSVSVKKDFVGGGTTYSKAIIVKTKSLKAVYKSFLRTVKLNPYIIAFLKRKKGWFIQARMKGGGIPTNFPYPNDTYYMHSPFMELSSSRNSWRNLCLGTGSPGINNALEQEDFITATALILSILTGDSMEGHTDIHDWLDYAIDKKKYNKDERTKRIQTCNCPGCARRR